MNTKSSDRVEQEQGHRALIDTSTDKFLHWRTIVFVTIFSLDEIPFKVGEKPFCKHRHIHLAILTLDFDLFPNKLKALPNMQTAQQTNRRERFSNAAAQPHRQENRQAREKQERESENEHENRSRGLEFL